MANAKPFDAAEYLDSPEMIAAYLNEASESGDASAIAVAIGTVASARGILVRPRKPSRQTRPPR
ncbi:DNA-binding protein [Bradyrhizobium sp. sGM-13]|uniref:helix-turn-helix domain-containing transcriptional regulator n=1 Tax=Bradyrhizobium sp. sGM-13 TaxID=2831781 RepID=UPI0035C7F6C6